jgi:hypothetical protein
MKTDQLRGITQGFETLRQFARKPDRKVEHCELCHRELSSEHPHLIEMKQRRLICSCDACAMLFSDPLVGKLSNDRRGMGCSDDSHQFGLLFSE